jgi:SAM-dependent methyltransferase
LGVLLNSLPAPSPWLLRFAHLIQPGGTVLDVACGSGRHLRWLVAQGFVVTGVDRDVAAVAPLRESAEIIVADIENAAWPIPHRRFDAVVGTNYLWRPLWPALLGALADNGVLIVETFADGQQHIGKPARPEFLLQAGELLRLCADLRVIAFEDGFDALAPRYVQRIVATPQRSPAVTPSQYLLTGAAG